MQKITLFWFRRDLRLQDNTGLFQALKKEENVLPLFIFDRQILDKLEDKSDARVSFIHLQLQNIHQKLEQFGSSILIKYGNPEEIYLELLSQYKIEKVYTNSDYEPYARDRDQKISELLNRNNIPLLSFKDHVIFEPEEIQNGSGSFYKVFTPFSRAWIAKFQTEKPIVRQNFISENFLQISPIPLIKLEDMGFSMTEIPLPSLHVDEVILAHYDQTRNFPSQNGTSRLGVHLRFGTISIRQIALIASKLNPTFLNELIWREFYVMILALNPQVVHRAFKPQYDTISWRNDEEEYAAWCAGKTGYPIVDAGMRELNATGYMHNRVRMIVASFLTKHLLIDWKWGEAYFAKKLLDFELASNNGGWQWAAGTGTDAQPYFRVFNPESQTEKFDKDLKYIKKWIVEFGTPSYPRPIVEHKFARLRALETYKNALNQ